MSHKYAVYRLNWLHGYGIKFKQGFYPEFLRCYSGFYADTHGGAVFTITGPGSIGAKWLLATSGIYIVICPMAGSGQCQFALSA